MKISMTTLAVLLSASAVQALPADPPTPPPTVSDGVKDSLEDFGGAAGTLVGGIISGIPKLIGELKNAKEQQMAWKNEQERKQADRARRGARSSGRTRSLYAAVKEANELREAINQIDKAAAVIELPEEEWPGSTPTSGPRPQRSRSRLRATRRRSMTRKTTTDKRIHWNN
ncbi:hypothetical protein F5883DRAFT_700102 [Diaporthe sp. PMI_573]|nr:hypothetical protein F5883DRAFT_700102 [Diaporthaceae sp. PMI_573]